MDARAKHATTFVLLSIHHSPYTESGTGIGLDVLLALNMNTTEVRMTKVANPE